MTLHDDPVPGRAASEIMLLGTFHFQDAGLDRYKPQFDVKILSDQRQREVADVVERLVAYQPTKIAVERRLDRQQELDGAYRDYLTENSQLPASEVY